MKDLARIIGHTCVLTVATLVLAILAWLDYCTILNGLSSQLMGFEQEPAEGWSYWRWYFIKENLGGILIGAAILLALFGVVLYGWFKLLRSIQIRRIRR